MVEAQLQNDSKQPIVLSSVHFAPSPSYVMQACGSAVAAAADGVTAVAQHEPPKAAGATAR